MVSVTHLAKYLLSLDPQRSVARLSFYHFVKNFFNHQHDFKPSMLDAFYAQALLFPYWQNNREDLGEILEADLYELSKRSELEFDIKTLNHAQNLQVLFIENQDDFLKVVRRRISNNLQKGDRIQLISISDSELLALHLKAGGSLSVYVFPRWAMVSDGQLTPLGPRVSLHYEDNMELSPRREQLLATSHMNMACFQSQNGQIQGSMVTGHTFSRYEAMDGPLNEYPDVFYALKKVERHFIQPLSDPFYHEIVALLEKALRFLKSKHPDAVPLAEKSLQKGRMAMKNVFPKDRVLLLLTAQLDSILGGHTHGQSQSNEYSHSPQ